MTTSIAFYNGDTFIRQERLHTCCSYVKGSDFSGTANKMKVYYPYLTTDKNTQRIIDMINFFFGALFTLELVTDDERVAGLKSAFAGNHGSMTSYIEIVTHGNVLNQLLFPLTLSRWVMTEDTDAHEYAEGRKALLEWLDAYPDYSKENPIALFYFLDTLHSFYPVTSERQSLYWDKDLFAKFCGSTYPPERPEVTSVLDLLEGYKLGGHDKDYGNARYTISKFINNLDVHQKDIHLVRYTLLVDLGKNSQNVGKQVLEYYQWFKDVADKHIDHINNFMRIGYENKQSSSSGQDELAAYLLDTFAP